MRHVALIEEINPIPGKVVVRLENADFEPPARFEVVAPAQYENLLKDLDWVVIDFQTQPQNPTYYPAMMFSGSVVDPRVAEGFLCFVELEQENK